MSCGAMTLRASDGSTVVLTPYFRGRNFLLESSGCLQIALRGRMGSRIRLARLVHPDWMATGLWSRRD